VVPELSSWKFSGNSTHSAKLSSVFFPSSFFKEKNDTENRHCRRIFLCCTHKDIEKKLQAKIKKKKKKENLFHNQSITII
jgi:hypothetical protein